MKKTKTKLITAILVAVLFFIPLALFDKTAFSQQVDITEINDYQEWDGDKIIQGRIWIGPEGTLVIKRGADITFDGEWAGLEVEGALIIKGTVKEPVNIRKSDGADGYSIIAYEGGKITARNVDVSGGGLASGILLKKDTDYWNKAYAFGDYNGAFHAIGGVLDIEGANFHDNFVAVGGEHGSIKVNRSKFSRNEIPVVEFHQAGGPGLAKADFQYNWWGDVAGPRKCDPRIGCHENEILGNIVFSNWATQEDFHDPVIIIPGIMGSQKRDGKWHLDLILRTYDNLYSAFSNNKYVTDKDLFTFPYEWRDSNIENAKLLRDKINQIKEDAKWPKVDIVGHSMGGLLAREYVESDYYQNDVDQLITLGTPHNGAPKSYPVWEAAEGLFNIDGFLIKQVLKYEASKNGYDDLFSYIKDRPIASLQELLPVYDYLYESLDNNAIRKYPHNYPKNYFLESLNNEEGEKKLRQVEFNKIIGKVESDKSTIAGFSVINVDFGKYWIHGYPRGFEIVFGNRGILRSKGDRTVPLESARSENIPSDYTIEINSGHIDLPTEAQKDVLELLTGVRPESEERRSLVKSILFFSVFSPVDIQIISPDGKRAGKNFETGEIFNEIEGAYYTGYDTDTEFLTIPDPSNGEYKILTQGTGDGAYTIEAVKISEDPQLPEEATQVTGTLRGVAELGRQQENVIEVKDTEIITSEQDTIGPNIEIISPEEKEYINDERIAIEYRAEDNVTAPEKIKTVLFLDGNEIQPGTIDLSLESLGVHILKISATDEAGNESQKEVSFTNAASLDSIQNNVAHYFDLGLISNNHEKRYLQAYLRAIQRVAGIEERINKNTRLSSDAREKIIKKIHEALDRNIAALITQLQKPGKFKSIDAKAKTLLIESFEYVRQLLARED